MKKETTSQSLGGAAFYFLVGTAWATYGVHSLFGWGQLWPAAGLTLTALALLASFLSVRRAVGPEPVLILTPAEQGREAREGRVFVWVNGAQGVAIFLMINFCINLHRPGYIAPLFALIVGLHFFVLAPALKTRSLWAIGILLCLLVVVTLLAVPQPLWRAAVGLGSGVVFLGGGAFRLQTAQLASRERPNAEQENGPVA